jgi:hypothetical protein
MAAPAALDEAADDRAWRSGWLETGNYRWAGLGVERSNAAAAAG